MSRSNDAGHFFQTSDALATSERKAAKAKNKHGSPIKLPSKILAACQGSQPNKIFVAEAAGEVKLVDLETQKITRIFTQGSAPLTCLALQDEKTLFTGSWDKNIYAVGPLQPSQTPIVLRGHTDFIKCLLITALFSSDTRASVPILISGSADATIIIWSLSPSSYGKVLHKLKGHTKSIQSLTIDHFATPDDNSHTVLLSSSSTPEIRRWRISLTSASELPSPITSAHETSIYQLVASESGDIYTASADNTAKRLIRDQNFAVDTTLSHPDFVRAVLPFEELGLVVTGCRDEEVRVWDIASGKVVCKYSGHFEEVSGLVPREDGRGFVSVSLDGTVRTWSLIRTDMEKYLEEIRKEEESGEVKEDGVKKEGMLTAEEEAELAELMDDDD